MIPVVQLDPASLTLWYNPELLSATDGGERLAEVADAALRGEISQVRSLVFQITDDSLKWHAMHLASSIWHEQRHFLDLLLFNYGALRFRQFYTIYVNLEALAAEARQSDCPIVCPLDVYADPVRSKVMGIEAKQPNLAAQAANLKLRKETLEVDRNTLDTPAHGPIEVGGEAQLEALAYFCQYEAIQEFFGKDASFAIQRDTPGESGVYNMRYRWAILFGELLGILPGKLTGSKQAILDVTLVCATIAGSLASRAWMQQQASSDAHSSAMPAGRLAGFAQKLRNSKPGFEKLSTKDAWAMVNEAASSLWGRSVVEEVEADFECEGKFISSVKSNDMVPEPVKGALLDYHTLRSALIDILKKNPEMIIDPNQFIWNLMPALRPIPIVAAPGGRIGEPVGADRVIGFREPGSTDPEAKWWWAAAPRDWPHGDFTVAVMRNRDAWMSIVDFYAPVAKMMINGRRHRIMLGPEILGAEKRLEAGGLKIRFDPLFEFPEEIVEPGFFWTLTRLKEAKCDLCQERILRGGGHVISPWVFRYDFENAKFGLAAFGGGEHGRLRFMRDWSQWILCDSCETRFVVREPRTSLKLPHRG